MAMAMAVRGALCPTIPAVRMLHASAASRGIEEFFSPIYGADGEGNMVRQTAGRSWNASELRGKSFEDLHKLWWVCLKEKNALTTDRLYFNQVGVEMPDASRVKKVTKTMARIKRVLWERHRATDLAVEERGLNPESLPRYTGEPVTLKKFGRKVTVPSDHAWAESPTRAEKKDLARRQRSAARDVARKEQAGRRRAAADAAVPSDIKEWYKQREAGLLKKASVDDAVGRAEADERFGSMDTDLEALRESAANEVLAAAAKRKAQRNKSQKAKKQADKQADKQAKSAEGDDERA